MLHENIKTDGIVLFEKELGEDDKLFFLYTKNFGKLEVLGKAIRKPKAKLRGGLQVLNYIFLEFVQGKNFNIATDAIVRHSFLKIKNSLKAFRSVFYICNLLNVLTEPNDKDLKIWQLLLDTFQEIEKRSEKTDFWLFVRYFEWNLFVFLGFEPELYKCIECRERISSGKIFFSAKNGGVLCEKCTKNKNKIFKAVSRDVVKILRLIINQDKEILQKLKTTKEQELELKKISKYFIANILQEKVFVI